MIAKIPVTSSVENLTFSSTSAIRVTFRPHPNNVYTLRDTAEGVRCGLIVKNRFALLVSMLFGGRAKTLFLEEEIKEGCYQWSIKINYGSLGYPDFWFGLAPADQAALYDNSHLGSTPETAALHFYKWFDNSTLSDLCGVKNMPTKVLVREGSVVTMEVNVAKKRLYFSVGGTMILPDIPISLSKIPKPWLLGVSTCNGEPCFTSVLFRRLPTSSSSPSPSSSIPFASSSSLTSSPPSVSSCSSSSSSSLSSSSSSSYTSTSPSSLDERKSK